MQLITFGMLLTSVSTPLQLIEMKAHSINRGK